MSRYSAVIYQSDRGSSYIAAETPGRYDTREEAREAGLKEWGSIYSGRRNDNTRIYVYDNVEQRTVGGSF
jgi:hypothetical protein